MKRAGFIAPLFRFRIEITMLEPAGQYNRDDEAIEP